MARKELRHEALESPEGERSQAGQGPRGEERLSHVRPAPHHIQLIKRLNFENFSISVSLDDADPVLHDQFRGYPGSFKKAMAAIRLIRESSVPGLSAVVRSTVKPSGIKDMEKLVRLTRKIGCKRIGFSAVNPVGRAAEDRSLMMSKEQKREFLNEIAFLQSKFTDIAVTTADPLRCLVCSEAEDSERNELVFDGCGAATVTFNVNSDGTITPCALLDVQILNVLGLSVDQIDSKYSKSSVVKNLLARRFKGKCGKCQLKYSCGGCRSRALADSGDYLGQDPHC